MIIALSLSCLVNFWRTIAEYCHVCAPLDMLKMSRSPIAHETKTDVPPFCNLKMELVVYQRTSIKERES